MRGLLSCLVALTACTTLTPEDPRTWQEPEPAAKHRTAGYPGYLGSRLNDLLDALPFSVGAGPGLLARVHVPLVGTGLGVAGNIDRFGWPDASCQAVRAGVWHEYLDVGVVLGAARGTDLLNYEVLYLPLGPVRGEHGPGGFDWPQLLDCEATVHIGYVGARAGVSLIQCIDFALGWIGIDLAADDQPAEPWPSGALR